ncbi:MAG TPA: cysteine desulfurase family protein [Methylovirgula sp.]|nr:cysteine desulfurase family protein [Methylovirgula sp.]
MSQPRAYLDHNATTPLRPEARAAMVAGLDLLGNASSIHAEGRAARTRIEAARDDIAALVGTAAKNVVFTSGATEALNLVLTPDLDLRGQSGFDRLLLGGGEHSCVLAGHRFAPEAVEILPLTADGSLDLAALGKALAKGGRALLALQAANNETGVIQPVAEAAALVHAAGGAVICDAAQAAGRIACDFTALPADALALSAHKFGGPQGAGALCFAPGAYHIKSMMLRGGGQERGLRAGTENVAGIMGLAAALKAAVQDMPELSTRLAEWRDAMERRLAEIVPDMTVFGAAAPRLPNTSNVAVPLIEAQVLLMSMDMEGVAISSGSACSSGKVKRSHVLEAMGVPSAVAQGAIRVSLGWNSGPQDLAQFEQAFAKAVRTIKARQVQPAA